MPKDQKKKQPSAYALFIKKHYNSVREKPLRERFKILAQRWHAQKKKKTTAQKA